ncbi:MAG: hypothetical protein JXB03_06680 [Spirochaetales bacterium]|nr:hypothetical protein [Spirochaetales bacterium]
METFSTFNNVFRNLILSASGFRMVFSDDEESPSPDVSTDKLLVCACIAQAFAEYYVTVSSQTLLLATDARPTGKVLALTTSQIMRKHGIQVSYIGIASAPEAMCFAAKDPSLGGFCYISASHNPIGHNGFKFGLDDGGVLDGSKISPIIQRIRDLSKSESALTTLARELHDTATAGMIIHSEDPAGKQKALSLYESFLVETAFPDDNGILDTFRSSLHQEPIGIIGELNGSARSVSADPSFFKNMSIRARFYNDTPGAVVHPIVPEGENLYLCRQLLKENYDTDPCFSLGYVPDNDGDRGNIVYMHPESGKAHILKAQEVFAVSVLSELLFIKYLEQNHRIASEPTAVVVNGPTSMRIDDIAATLGARVFRAEVGEANVVQLAKEKAKEGFRIRILGEGSNGGNITFPAAVRDPLNTIMSFVKLLRLKGDYRHKGLFETWCELRGMPYRKAFGVHDVLSTLPAYTTTDAFSELAKMQINTTDHGLLKQRYEKLLIESVKPFPDVLYREFGALHYEFINYEGTCTRRGAGNRTNEQRGGFKILIKQGAPSGKAIAYVWMRGSGTEPVFRVMADVASAKPELDHELLLWHRDLIARADKG